jgi:hypothetical protein
MALDPNPEAFGAEVAEAAIAASYAISLARRLNSRLSPPREKDELDGVIELAQLATRRVIASVLRIQNRQADEAKEAPHA